MGMFDQLFGPEGMSVNNLLAGVGQIVGGPFGGLVGGVGHLLGSLFGDNTVQQSRNTQASMNMLADMYKRYGIDPSKPFVTSEEKRDDWSLNYGRNQFGRAQNFRSLISSQSEALNNALSRMGLSNGIGATAMKVGIGTLAPLLANYDAQDAALTMEYAKPLRTTYEDRMKQFANIAQTGAGISTQNYTQQYRTSELGRLADIFSALRSANLGSDALKNLDEETKRIQEEVMKRLGSGAVIYNTSNPT